MLLCSDLTLPDLLGSLYFEFLCIHFEIPNVATVWIATHP